MIPRPVALALALSAVAAAVTVDAADLESREVSFGTSKYRLVGTLTSPSQRPIIAGVLIIPGSGPVDRDGVLPAVPAPPVYRQWAERLGAAGFAVLRYDKRYLTHRSIDPASVDQAAQIEDARLAVAQLRTAAPRVFIVGHSEGGTLAPLVAERAGAIAGVVIVNAVQFPVDELLVAQLQANAAVPPSTVAEVKARLAKIKDGSFPRDGVLLGAGADYWAQWIEYSRTSPARLARLAMPLLLIQCSSDETLPGDALARNVELLRGVVAANPRAQLRELRGHDHFGVVAGAHEASSDLTTVVLDWLRKEGRAEP